MRAGDDYYGWAAQAPYDGIIATAAAPHRRQPLSDQLKPGGYLVIPIDAANASLEKRPDKTLNIEDILAVVFAPLTGAHHDQPVM